MLLDDVTAREYINKKRYEITAYVIRYLIENLISGSDKTSNDLKSMLEKLKNEIIQMIKEGNKKDKN